MKITNIAETSKELTAREKLMMEDVTDAFKLNEITDPIIITPAQYAVLHVEDEDPDVDPYDKFIVIDNDGNKYTTGSKSFMEAFKKIWNVMSEEDEEYQIKVYKVKSQKRDGSFLTCSIV